MGYFQHGSTILVFASEQYQLCPGIVEGQPVRMGEALLSGHPLQARPLHDFNQSEEPTTTLDV
jgi:phosphatidylserine decarboxylase